MRPFERSIRAADQVSQGEAELPGRLPLSEELSHHVVAGPQRGLDPAEARLRALAEPRSEGGVTGVLEDEGVFALEVLEQLEVDVLRDDWAVVRIGRAVATHDERKEVAIPRETPAELAADVAESPVLVAAAH
jgi:hypothetical protein